MRKKTKGKKQVAVQLVRKQGNSFAYLCRARCPQRKHLVRSIKDRKGRAERYFEEWRWERRVEDGDKAGSQRTRAS